MSPLFLCFLAVAFVCNAQCDVEEEDYTECISAVTACLDVVRQDVVTSEHICTCYERYKYFDCLDYEACKDETFVADNRADIEDYECLVEPEPVEEEDYHNDWSRWYTYNFWRHWPEGEDVNATGFDWEDLFTIGETEGSIEFGDVTMEEAAMTLDEFSNNVEEVLETECERQVEMADVDYDCTGVEFGYELFDNEEGATELNVRFVFSSAYVLQLSIALLSSVALFFVF